MKMNPVVHFELPAEDKDRAAEFYEKTFGWEIQRLGEEYGGYMVAMTTESDANGPKEKGIINGGIYKKSKPEQVPHVVIAVDDIHEHIKKVEEAGGKVVGGSSGQQIDDIPGVGLFAAILDTEGNSVGMLQPVERGSMSQ